MARLRRRSRWGSSDVPGQGGRTAVITGANSGVGFETAAVLAARGARVVLACRDTGKAELAAVRIRSQTPAAQVDVVRLDLSEPDSIRAATEDIRYRVDRIDLLINNAGVLWPPFSRTAQGIELQFATNHLGHFAFAGELLDMVLKEERSRVVTVASVGHWLVRDIDLDDLGFRGRYKPFEAYGRSKLANLLFTYELNRRLTRSGVGTVAVAAHPGGSRTELIRRAPDLKYSPMGAGLLRRLMQHQPAHMGALPTLRASTDPDVRGGEYFGPDGFLEIRGHPKVARSSGPSRDPELARRLWERSVEITGVSYPV